MVWLRVPYRLLYKRPQPDRGRKYEYTQPHGQENLPSDFHELVKAVTRERATIPDIEVHERGNFHGEPINVADAFARHGNKQNNAYQSEHGSKGAEAQGLNPEIWMLGHPGCAV